MFWPFPTFNKSTPDNFENILLKNVEIFSYCKCRIENSVAKGEIAHEQKLYATDIKMCLHEEKGK